MFDPNTIDVIRDARDLWEETTLQKSLARAPERSRKFITTSSDEVERLYTPAKPQPAQARDDRVQG